MYYLRMKLYREQDTINMSTTEGSLTGEIGHLPFFPPVESTLRDGNVPLNIALAKH